ncbi:MAG: hypothetical protein R3F56_14490 [Planctomycetota bacterium]
MPILRLLSVLFVALLGSLASGQKKAEFLVPIPEKLERATEPDEQGLLQFVAHKAERCPNCKGRQVMPCLHCDRFEEGDCDSCPECKNTKEATCRICAGTGETVDILQRAPCPTCFGAAVTNCFVCGGRGKFPVQGGGSRKQKCGCCGGAGAYPCTTCSGKRYVDLPALKPSASDAKTSDLEKALEAIDAVAAELDKFLSTGDGRKDAKALATVTAAGGKVLPVMRRVQKHFEDTAKKQAKGSVWTHYADSVKADVAGLRQALSYYLKHQKRVLELCLARARHNEEALAGKKK